MKKKLKVAKLHRAEEKLHHMAERAMKADEKVHEKIEKLQRKPKKKDPKYSKKAEGKIHKVMKEFSEGRLHARSKKGPIVTNPKMAIAIGISEAKRRGYKVSRKKK